MPDQVVRYWISPNPQRLKASFDEVLAIAQPLDVSDASHSPV
jgi:hypothetical protein